MAEYSAETNWPLVAGIGVIAAVVFYALYIINNAANTAEQPIQDLTADIQGVINWFGNLFGGGSSDQ